MDNANKVADIIEATDNGPGTLVAVVFEPTEETFSWVAQPRAVGHNDDGSLPAASQKENRSLRNVPEDLAYQVYDYLRTRLVARRCHIDLRDMKPYLEVDAES